MSDANSGINPSVEQKHKVNSLVDHQKDCIHYWHSVLGHRDPVAISKMFNEGLVDGMKLVKCNKKIVCDTCMKAKSTRLPFPQKSLTKSTAVMDLVHSDVYSPNEVASLGGKHYIATFIDDFSRYTVIYFLRQKSDVEENLKAFVAMVKNKFGVKPKKVRFDRGGEYIGGENSNFLNSEGILVQLTSGYSPQQNGVAERKNRTLTEMSRCMLNEANLPKFLWAEAISTANYVQNRVVTSATGRTPYELWNGSVPNIKHLKVFGSRCFVHIPKAKRKKFDNAATEMQLVGYDEQSKAYRCYNKSNHKVVVSRDVRFDLEKLSVQVDVNLNRVENEVDLGSCEEEVESAGSTDVQGAVEQRIERSDDGEVRQQRASSRTNKGIPPKRLLDEIHLVHGEIVEPKNFHAAITGDQKEM